MKKIKKVEIIIDKDEQNKMYKLVIIFDFCFLAQS